jgi:hypothetical protein
MAAIGSIGNLLRSVPNTGIKLTDQIDYNNLANKIELAKDALERARAREKVAYEAARTSAETTSARIEDLKSLTASWADLTAQLVAIVDD